MSTTLYVPAAAVWNMVGGFNQLARWHPAVASSEEKSEKGATIRKLTLHGGGTIIEKLDGLDPKERTYTYSILESPLPVAGYKAKLHVTEAEDGRSCTVEWSSEFEASGAPENEAVVRRGEWNEYVLEVRGNRYISRLNGVVMVDFTDPQPRSFDGTLALQLHSGGTGDMKFREIWVRDLTQR